jgi:RimJ/RimL family protein N-acetyltransferase
MDFSTYKLNDGRDIEIREAVVIEWAKSTHIIKKINCRVRTDNHTAIRLFKRKEFVNEGTIIKKIFLNGKYYDLLLMGLEL